MPTDAQNNRWRRAAHSASELAGGPDLTIVEAQAAKMLDWRHVNAGDDEAIDWAVRLRAGALHDFLYNRVALDVGRQAPLTLIVRETNKRDVEIKPYHGVRNAADGTYDQLGFLTMTRNEYDTWRRQEIAAILAIDALWDEHPGAPTIRDLYVAVGVDPDAQRIQLAS